MRGTWNTSCCPAPVRTDGGVLRCVTRRPCRMPGHARWDRWRYLLAVVWWVRPWWPNALGRAQDRGTAHTPNVQPCRHCHYLNRLSEETGYPLPVIRHVEDLVDVGPAMEHVLTLARLGNVSPVQVARAVATKEAPPIPTTWKRWHW